MPRDVLRERLQVPSQRLTRSSRLTANRRECPHPYRRLNVLRESVQVPDSSSCPQRNPAPSCAVS